jgi:hypothetical protein
MVALVPLVHDLVASSLPALYGTVFPARKGDPIAIQQSSKGRWRTVLHARLAANGGYQVQLPGSGAYRIVVDGIDGPSVNAH